MKRLETEPKTRLEPRFAPSSGSPRGSWEPELDLEGSERLEEVARRGEAHQGGQEQRHQTRLHGKQKASHEGDLTSYEGGHSCHIEP